MIIIYHCLYVYADHFTYNTDMSTSSNLVRRERNCVFRQFSCWKRQPHTSFHMFFSRIAEIETLDFDVIDHQNRTSGSIAIPVNVNQAHYFLTSSFDAILDIGWFRKLVSIGSEFSFLFLFHCEFINCNRLIFLSVTLYRTHTNTESLVCFVYV